MRFLSKNILLIFLIIATSFIVAVFSCGIFNQNRQCISVPVSNTFNDCDNIIFNFRHNNKIWSFSSDEFDVNSDLFNIDERIKRFNRNGTRQDKIKLINKLIQINIPPDIAFNYIYFGFNRKKPENKLY